MQLKNNSGFNVTHFNIVSFVLGLVKTYVSNENIQILTYHCNKYYFSTSECNIDYIAAKKGENIHNLTKQGTLDMNIIYLWQDQ